MIFRFMIAASVIGVLLSGSARAERGSVAESCPAYRTHLRTARTYLVRGDRGATLSELRRAQEALESCLREDAGEIALASSRTLWTPVA